MGSPWRTVAMLLIMFGNVMVFCCQYQNLSSGFQAVLLQPDQPCPVTLQPNSKFVFQPNSTAGYGDGFVVVQVHTQTANITVSLSPSFAAGASQNGTGLGVVIPLLLQRSGADSPQPQAVAYVWNFNYKSVSAVALASLYSADVPVPGGCNEEFLFEDDANIHLGRLTQEPLAAVQFQYADLPLSASAGNDWCDDKTSWTWLFYDVYISYLPERNHLEYDYLQRVQQFMTVRDVVAHGDLVLTIQRGQSSVKPRLSLMADPGQGFLMNIVVRSINNSGMAAAYIPAVTYSCDITVSGDCLGSSFGMVTAVQSVAMLAGLVLCFLGHRLFKFETFVVGSLVFLLLTYIALAKTTTLPLWGLLSVALVCSAVGGCGWLAFWLCFGRAHLSMLPTFFVFGYVLAMVVFVTPFGTLTVLHNDVAYWPVFCGYMLYIPVVSAFCIKRWAHFNLVMCSVIGSYCCVSALSSFVGAAVHRWVLLPVLRATVPGYSEAVLVFPYQLKDVLLSATWVLLAAAGIGVQFYREKGQPSMPVLPSGPAHRRLTMRRTHSRVNPDLFTDERRRLLDNGEETRGPPPAYGAINDRPQLQQAANFHSECRTLPTPPPAYGTAN